MNVPTAPYRVTAPEGWAIEQYLGWFVDKAVRVGRDNGYGNIVDDGIELFLRTYNVRRPAGGFVDSDGRNAQGRLTTTPAPAPVDEVDEDEVAAMVEGWSAEFAAAVLGELATRVA